MNKPLKLIPIGNSAGVIIPKETLKLLGAEVGDSLFLVQTATGIEFRRSDPDSEFEEEMRLAREIMFKRRNVLRELAK